MPPHMETTMNSQDSCPALYYSVNPSEAAGGGAEGADAFLDKFGDRQSLYVSCLMFLIN
jgi:hypothetical protein